MKNIPQKLVCALALVLFLPIIAAGETAPKAQVIVFAQEAATHLSDYQFQLDQYRKNYAEYQNFKKDYDTRPSLSNEQKALLSAKAAITARELTWANFTLVLSDQIKAPGIKYSLTDKAVTDLEGIVAYHFSQASSAGKIITRADLTAFTLEELKVLKTHGLSFAQAEVANKLATLIKFQLDAKTAYDVIQPKLAPVKDEISVINGLAQVKDYSKQINEKIDALAKKTSELSFEQSSQAQFYTDASEALAEIRMWERRLVDVIIDLDTNYVPH